MQFLNHKKYFHQLFYTKKQIEYLREYRTRLISDVVTGQIDVRDVVIPEYTPEEDVEIDTDDIGEDVEEVAEDAE